MDATRQEDGRLVSLKTIRRNQNELDIALSLTSSSLVNHSMNHCVQILDTFSDPIEPDTYFIVMPYLRPFDDPPFGAVGEVIDFIRQTLEVRVPSLLSVSKLSTIRPYRVCALSTVRWLPIGQHFLF